MSERHTEHQERHERTHEHLEEAHRQKLEELRQNATVETDDAAKRAEAAREIIRGHDQPEPEPEPTAPENHAPTPRLIHYVKQNYAETLGSLQRKLDPVSRNFSKFIHVPAVEKTSEVLEKTVARPSVMLGTTWTALIVGSVFYFTARHYGYMLSGSELLFSFVVGALLGIVIEGLVRLVRPPRG